MAKTFTAMKDEVASMCLDTTSNFKTLAGAWINDAYHDAAKRFYWTDLIDTDYTLESVVGTAKYDIPALFLREVKMVNIATGKELVAWDIRKWWQARAKDFSQDVLTSGTPERYLVLREEAKIQLDPTPIVAETYQLVYQKDVVDMSGADDVSAISQLDSYLVKYAIGQGFAYYKQYDKADWWLQKAELELVKISGFHNSTIEQDYRRYNKRNNSFRWFNRFTGGNSYDSI